MRNIFKVEGDFALLFGVNENKRRPNSTNLEM